MPRADRRAFFPCWRMAAALSPMKTIRGRLLGGVLCAVLCAVLASAAASATEINTPRGIGPALMACWKPPSGTEGLTATARFSFRSDGSLLGPPRITFARLGENDPKAREFLNSIADAFNDCTPLSFTESFARSVAGRIFTMRFIPVARRV